MAAGGKPAGKSIHFSASTFLQCAQTANVPSSV